MRNLILFLTRNSYFILFLFLESLALFLVINNNHFQRAHFLNSSNAMTGSMYETWSGITDYFSLQEVNERLAAENVELKNQLQQPFASGSGTSVTVNDSLKKQQYVFINAKVVNNSTTRRKNFLTLNAGSAQGVKKETAVISHYGIVGIVRDVSENFCSVMSVLNEDMRVPVRIEPYGENSVLTWNGNDAAHAKLERVPSHLPLKKGDSIVTGAYSSIFPEGVKVGTIEHFEIIAGNTFYDVTVKLSTNFNRLSYVNIVTNLMKDEQTSLEKTSQHDQ